MKLPDFKVEQWMNEYENEAVYNLTDTCVSPLTFQQLAAMDESGSFMNTRLDYGTITGDRELKE
ncbi:MAG: aspartate aminotransferase, partial [Erysipelotrichaceae bacterium]|nr:aspartate aminotransferase [Erysipelotrichaceae bacterium]